MSEQEQKHEYVFHPADLVEYAMDKPIGAARAALKIGLECADGRSRVQSMNPDSVLLGRMI